MCRHRILLRRATSSRDVWSISAGPSITTTPPRLSQSANSLIQDPAPPFARPADPREHRPYAGVHFATIGWILPMLHDPDGREVRVYTVEHHTELDAGSVSTVHDLPETADRRALEHDVASGS